MIWRWLTCFSLLAAQAGAADVTGSVTLRDSREAAVRKSGDFSGVVISLDPLDFRAAPLPAHARMLQKDKMFRPHILPIQVGTVVDFPNADLIFHNAFSSYSGQIFDIGLYPPGTSRSVRFSRPGVVRVFCNIHATMSAIIVVLNTPYFTVTGADGRFHLNVPPGRYQLRVFHERATETTLNALARQVQVDTGGVQLPAIAISESGYLPAPHNDKFGRPYPPGSGDGPSYLGGHP